MIIQFCGLSGSGKSTIAGRVKEVLNREGIRVEVIDGDEYRRVLCPDLGFSKQDRNQNIRRLGFVASKLSAFDIVAIICAINPYEEIRQEIKDNYPNVKTIFINCNLETLVQRDTKGLYHKALLPDGHPEKITNLTGINDPFELPDKPDLTLDTACESIDESVAKLSEFIVDALK